MKEWSSTIPIKCTRNTDNDISWYTPWCTIVAGCVLENLTLVGFVFQYNPWLLGNSPSFLTYDLFGSDPEHSSVELEIGHLEDPRMLWSILWGHLAIWWGHWRASGGHPEDLCGGFGAFFHCGLGSSLDRWIQVIGECQTRWIGQRRKHDRGEAGQDISRMLNFWLLLNKTYRLILMLILIVHLQIT